MGSAGTDIVINVSAVFKEYRFGEQVVRALRGVDLQVRRGEFVALSGASGSGKTTLLNLLGCLDVPTSGLVEVLGVKLEDRSERDLDELRATSIGYIFQNFNLLPVLSAVENVEYPLLSKSMRSSVRRTKALDALRRVGLEQRAGHRPDELSGGQRQRVAIARAIVHQPHLIIADEPTSALDKKTALEILDLLIGIQKDFGLTIVMASHDPLALAKSSRVVQVSDGVLLPEANQ